MKSLETEGVLVQVHLVEFLHMLLLLLVDRLENEVEKASKQLHQEGTGIHCGINGISYIFILLLRSCCKAAAMACRIVSALMMSRNCSVLVWLLLLLLLLYPDAFICNRFFLILQCSEWCSV